MATYARFIPREELQGFSAWQPGSLGAERPAPASEPPPPPPVQSWKDKLAAVQQEGYEEGYRDGMAALEGFKKSYASQMSERVGQLLASFDQQLTSLESQLADSVVECAVLLARQVLRQELRARPEVVVDVAREAVETLVNSARQVVVRVHPDDLSLVAEGAAEALAARGARLQADVAIARGGCRVESDTGGVDATLESRWHRAAAALGRSIAWSEARTDAHPDVQSPHVATTAPQHADLS